MDVSKERQFQKSRPQIAPATQEGKWEWKRGVMIHHTFNMHFVFPQRQCEGITHLIYTFGTPTLVKVKIFIISYTLF